MIQNPKIHILLSTYNGESFIIEQLDSIFQQTYQNFTLFIRDDASSDHTLERMTEYFDLHPDYQEKIVFLSNPEHQNLGYIKSFWQLLSKCGNADYYAFCDQDDVWLPTKLAQAVSFLEQEQRQIPLLYFANYDYCDADLHFLHHAPEVKLPITFRDVLFYTPAFGFSILINHSLRMLALKTSDAANLPHDGWVQKLAAAFGKILYNPECSAYYRRHGNAVTASNAQKRSAIRHWIQHDILGSSMKETHFVLTRFQQEYGALLSEEDARLLKLYSAEHVSPILWLRRFLYKKRLRPSLGGDLALRICFFLNTF